MERPNILHFFFSSPCFSIIVTSSTFVYILAMLSFYLLSRKLAFLTYHKYCVHLDSQPMEDTFWVFTFLKGEILTIRA